MAKDSTFLPLFLFAGSMALLLMTLWGARRGETYLARARFRRAENPGLFWFAVIFNCGLGVGGLVLMVLALRG